MLPNDSLLPGDTLGWGTSRSCIRELFEYGARRKAEIGEDRVFDFSIGNPSVPAPDRFEKAMREVLAMPSVALHGYTSAAGAPGLRRAIAEDLNSRFGAGLSADNVYVTCGAAAGLAASLKGLLLPGEEVIAFAPFFPEYRVFTEGAGGIFAAVPPKMDDLQIDLAAFEAALTEKTKAVIVNSPNNPSGVVYSRESIGGLCAALRRHTERTGRRVFILCDEPYRELVYDGVEVPCLLNCYDDTVVCYSFSKSLSIPGERLGYIAVNPRMDGSAEVFASIAGAARCYGYVNAPSMVQHAVEKCVGATADISVYRANRDLLYNGLTALGFECVRPDGAFYLFVRAPEPDARAFGERAKAYELLLVPSDDFGLGGFVRVAYCVPGEMIRRALPSFERLAKEYGLI